MVLPLPTGGGQSSHQTSLIIFLGVGAYWTVLLIRSLSHPQPGWVAIVLFLTYHREIRLSVTTETLCESQEGWRMGLLVLFFYYYYLSSWFEDELFLVLSHCILFFRESALRIQFVKPDNHWQIHKTKFLKSLSDFIERIDKIRQKD